MIKHIEYIPKTIIDLKYLKENRYDHYLVCNALIDLFNAVKYEKHEAEYFVNYIYDKCHLEKFPDEAIKEGHCWDCPSIVKDKCEDYKKKMNK